MFWLMIEQWMECCNDVSVCALKHSPNTAILVLSIPDVSDSLLERWQGRN